MTMIEEDSPSVRKKELKDMLKSIIKLHGFWHVWYEEFDDICCSSKPRRFWHFFIIDYELIISYSVDLKMIDIDCFTCKHYEQAKELALIIERQSGWTVKLIRHDKSYVKECIDEI